MMKIKHLPVFVLSFFFLSQHTIAQTSEGVLVSMKVFLQGALIGVPDGESLMRDDLRKEEWLPINDPYVEPGNGDAIPDVAILEVTGSDAIVDWVKLELRTPTSPTISVATRSALLQRDGDVVALDGVSPVFFEEVEPGEYYVVVNHRNHLAIASGEPILLGTEAEKLNFSDPAYSVFGDYSRVKMGEVMAMWTGDVNRDGRFIMQGPDNDSFSLYNYVLADGLNTSGNANHIVSGYSNADINMDGLTIFSGTGSDRGMMFIQLYAKAFELYGDLPWPDGLFSAQIP